MLTSTTKYYDYSQLYQLMDHLSVQVMASIWEVNAFTPYYARNNSIPSWYLLL